MGSAPKVVVDIAGRSYTLAPHGPRYRWTIRDGHNTTVRGGGATADDAERTLRAALARIDKERVERGAGVSSKYSMGDVVDMWYQRKKPALDEGGRLDYEGRIRRDVSRIAHWVPEHIRRADIDDFYATLTPHTAHRLHPILNQAFEYAIDSDWVAVTQNPFRRIRPRRPPSKEIDVPTPREVEKMLVGADDHRWYMFLRLSAALGTRRSETVALQWRDIDFTNRRVHVRRAYAKLTRGFKLPKTHESRVLRFDAGDATDILFDDLVVYRAQYPDGDLLFPAARADSTSPCWHPDAVTHRFARFCGTAGLPYTHPHCLRHFVATHLLEAGSTSVQVAKWLGHKDDTQVRRLYGNHLREDAQSGIGAAAAGLVVS